METFFFSLTALLWVVCPVLIGLILLQGGAGDISSAFGGGGALDSTLGVGAGRKMSKITGWLAAFFFVAVTLLAIPRHGDLKRAAGPKKETPAPAVAPAPAAPAVTPAPVAPAAPAPATSQAPTTPAPTIPTAPAAPTVTLADSAKTTVDAAAAAAQKAVDTTVKAANDAATQAGTAIQGALPAAPAAPEAPAPTPAK